MTSEISELVQRLHVMAQCLPEQRSIFIEAADALTRSSERIDAGWQPIETAPKNGDLIDVWCIGFEDQDHRHAIRLTDVSWHEADKIIDFTGWLRIMDDGNVDPVELRAWHPGGLPPWKPTHWMPRPIGPHVSGTTEANNG